MMTDNPAILIYNNSPDNFRFFMPLYRIPYTRMGSTLFYQKFPDPEK